MTTLRDKALCVLMGKGLTMSHAQAVDALFAAGLLHDPTCEARIERAARADEAVDAVTRACREADPRFVAEGGSTRHWARDHFLPALRAEGYVVALAAADQEDAT